MKVIDKTRGFFEEFRSFAVKGNVFDLAVAVVIGNAFSAVVNSLVADIITPILGLATNNVDFKSLAVTVAPSVVIKYGSFIQATINFILISLSIFLIFKLISTARRRIFREGEKAVPPYEKPADVLLLEEIRDLLKRDLPVSEK
jgi:large conductance mechanosensitive channel